jgi:hypothetical protein
MLACQAEFSEIEVDKASSRVDAHIPNKTAGPFPSLLERVEFFRPPGRTIGPNLPV